MPKIYPEISDLPPHVRKLNADNLRAEGVEPLEPRTIDPGEDDGSEAALQRNCEALLTRRGYVRQTADNGEYFAIHRARLAGTFVHLRKPQGNDCILPDLIIFDKRGRALCVELKTEAGRARYRKGQKHYIGSRLWRQANNFDDFALLLNGWEDAARI